MIATLLALVLPQVAQPIAIDGELDEVAWRSPARTGPFTDATGAPAAPYSDARFLRDDQFLYLALYAADEDIRSTDEFVVKIGRATYHFTAAGTPIKGVRLAVDRDGSLDAPADDDEEWVVEAAIPIAGIPANAPIEITRCDTTKDRVQRCATWKGRLQQRR